MPTTLPVNFAAIPYAARPKPSPFSGASAEIVLVAAWALVMLSISLVALRHGSLLDIGAVFQ